MTYLQDQETFEAYPEFEDQLKWSEQNQFEDQLATQPEFQWFDRELEGLFGSIFNQVQDTLSRGKELLVLRQAIVSGNRDENSLTNMIFFSRHPDRQGRSITKTETNYSQLRQEWLDIRNQLVRPALQSASTPSASPTPTASNGNLTSFKQRVREIAAREWQFFERGSRKEHEHGFWQRVVRYWNEGLKVKWIDTKEEVTSIPWSAAFISWVMRTAGAGDRFKYDARHSVYIRDAIQKRKSNDNTAGFKGYKLSEVAPQVGDLVCASRGKDAGKVGYDTTRDYESHCDIVVATRPGKIEVIGGNVSQSVGKKTLDIDAQGRLIDKKYPWFVVIKNLL